MRGVSADIDLSSIPTSLSPMTDFCSHSSNPRMEAVPIFISVCSLKAFPMPNIRSYKQSKVHLVRLKDVSEPIEVVPKFQIAKTHHR